MRRLNYPYLSNSKPIMFRCFRPSQPMASWVKTQAKGLTTHLQTCSMHTVFCQKIHIWANPAGVRSRCALIQLEGYWKKYDLKSGRCMCLRITYFVNYKYVKTGGVIMNQLTSCKTCSKEVAQSTTVCPHCGAKLRMNLIKKLVLFAIVSYVALFLFAAIGMKQAHWFGPVSYFFSCEGLQNQLKQILLAFSSFCTEVNERTKARLDAVCESPMKSGLRLPKRMEV